MMQIISSVHFMAIPIKVIDSVIDAIAENPEGTNVILEKIREGHKPSDGVRAVFGSLAGSTQGLRSCADGLIMSPNLGGLAGLVKEDSVAKIEPEVIYYGKKGDKPEILFSSNLSDKQTLEIKQIPSKFANAKKMYVNLIAQRRWLVSSLRDCYTLLGEKQREFMSTLNSIELHSYTYDDFGEDMGLSASTISRLMKSKYVGVQSAD